MALGRRRLPEHLRPAFASFESLVPTLERAKAALTDSVPGPRLPGRALAESLVEFEEGLRSIRRDMDAWRAPEVEDAWRRAVAGLDAALAMAERVRIEAREPGGFVDLVGLVGDLLAPLEAFADADRRFRDLRAR